MLKYIAFLRGINSGQNPSQKMSALRKIFEDLGFENVRTVIASGNVIFDPPVSGHVLDRLKLEEKIEKALKEETGVEAITIVRTNKETEELVNLNPFNKVNLTSIIRPHVSFLKDPKAKTKLKFPFSNKNKGYTILGNYNGTIASIVDLGGAKTPELMQVLDREFGKKVTTRTWKTIEKILKSALI